MRSNCPSVGRDSRSVGVGGSPRLASTWTGEDAQAGVCCAGVQMLPPRDLALSGLFPGGALLLS